jgi:hypothetical protein
LSRSLLSSFLSLCCKVFFRNELPTEGGGCDIGDGDICENGDNEGDGGAAEGADGGGGAVE